MDATYHARTLFWLSMAGLSVGAFILVKGGDATIIFLSASLLAYTSAVLRRRARRRRPSSR
jgi:hypothetical protein